MKKTLRRALWILPGLLLGGAHASQAPAARKLVRISQESLNIPDPEALKARNDKSWDLSQSQGSVVSAGAAAKVITPFTQGKPWGEPFKPSDKSGHYVLGDKCSDLNHNGKCDQIFFGGYGSIEEPKKSWWKWIFRGPRRHPELYNTPDGVHDDLYARAFVMKAGGKKIGIVTVDAVGLIYSDTEKIREEVKDLGFDLVIVSATHNHEGPDTMGLWGPYKTPGLFGIIFDLLTRREPLHVTDGKNPQFMDFLYRQAGSALREADQNSRDSNLFFGSTPVPDFNGIPLIKDVRAPQVFDNDVHVLQARDLIGHSIATLANFGMHPVLFGNHITKLSADISGSIAGHLEQQGGGVGLHVNGAIEAINPNDLYGYDDKKRHLSIAEELALREKGIDTIGDLVSQTALKAVAQAQPVPIAKVGIVKRKIFIPMDNRFLETMARRGVIQRPQFNNGAEDPNGQDLMTEMDLIVMSGAKGEPLAEIFTIPGELAPEIFLGGFLKPQEAAVPQAPETPTLKNYLRAPNQYLIGLGNDELGYIVPLNDFLFPHLTHPAWAKKDKFGRNHYNETLSASSQLSQIVSLNLIGMLQEYYEGHTELTVGEVARRARRDALAAFAGQKEAVPALVKLYLHEPYDETTEKTREALLKMNINTVDYYLSTFRPATQAQKEMRAGLLSKIRLEIRRRERRER